MLKVSVVIPTYNREQYIKRAVDSVLKQTYPHYEIIIIDDGSTDNTKEVLTSYTGKIIYIYQDNQGISAARNKGINESAGEYIAFLDSDDFWDPEKLKKQVEVLNREIKVGIVYGRMPIINEKNEQIGFKPSGYLCKNFNELLKLGGDIPTSSVMTRKKCFKEVGLFDTDLSISEDFEMWLRIGKLYDFYEIDGKPLAFYFRHDGQITKNLIKVYQGQIKTDLKILKTFSEAPSTSISNGIAKKEYMTAKIYYNENNYSMAINHLWKAFNYSFFVGVLFFDSNDEILNRLNKFLKPYGFFFICYIKQCLNLNKRHPD